MDKKKISKEEIIAEYLTGNVKHRLHIGFDDPSLLIGSAEFIWSDFQRVRDEIKEGFYKFYIEHIKK